MSSRRAKVIQQDILDVLLGDADAELEQRVRQAVRHNRRMAHEYQVWAALLPTLQAELRAEHQRDENLRRNIAARLSECAPTSNIPIPPSSRWGWIGDCRWKLSEWLARPDRPAVVSPVFASAFLAVAMICALVYLEPLNRVRIEWTAGQAVRVTHATHSAPLVHGERLRLPLTVRTGEDGRLELRLPRRSSIRLAANTEIRIENREMVRQRSGHAAYRVGERAAGRFRVSFQQGRVLDLGTTFQVDTVSSGPAIVRIDQGRVRIEPKAGPAVEAGAGERAVVGATYVRLGFEPTLLDLGDERARFRTVLREVPPRPDLAPPSLPPGAREVYFPSGDLRLRGWLGQKADIAQSQEKRPALVWLHDGEVPTAAEWAGLSPLIENGWVMLVPTLRGEAGNPGQHEFFYGEADDAIAAGTWLALRPGVDSERVFVAGRGRGGTLAALCAMLDSTFAAAAGIEARLDPRAYLDENWRQKVPYIAYDSRESLLRAPGAFPASLRIPLLLSARDPELSVSAKEFATVATRLGRVVKTVPISDPHPNNLGTINVDHIARQLLNASGNSGTLNKKD